MSDKFIPDDPRQFAEFFRKRAEGHAPGYDLAVYARPHQWLEIAKLIEDNCPRAPWCAPVVDDTNPGAGAEPATRQADHGRAAVGRTGGSIPPTGAKIEKTAVDAPCHHGPQEADAWASGYNAAISNGDRA